MKNRQLVNQSVSLLLLAVILGGITMAATNESAGITEEIWMEAPSLGVMPHLIAPVLDDVRKWDEGLGSKFNADEWAKAFRELGASYVYGVAKWHDGFCYWDTDTTSYKSKNDNIGQLIKACQKQDLRFVFYFNHHTEGNPEWEHTQLHDKKGNPYRQGYPFPKHTVYNEFRQFTLGQIEELLTQYGQVDGIWLDHFRELTDVSDEVVHDAFEEMFGYPLKDANRNDQIEFSARSLASYLQDIEQIAEEAGQDSFLITMNGGLRYSTPGDAYTKFIGAHIDYPSQEGHYIPRLEERVRRGGLIGKPLDIGVKFNESWHVIPGYENPLILNRDQAIAISSMAVFHASSLWLGMIPDYDGSFGPNLELARHVGEWFRTVRPHLDGIEPYRDVGFLMGNPDFYCSRSLDMPNTHWKSYPLQRMNALDEVVIQINALREAGYAADMFAQWWDGTATWPNNLSCYRAVVIPEGAVLDDKAADEIREYVRQGGTVIGFAHSGRFDEFGGKRAGSLLEDLFGVKVGNQIPLSSEYNPTLLQTSTFENGLVNGSKTLMDGKPTIWRPKPDDPSPWIELTFSRPVDVKKLIISNSSGPTAHPNDPATTFIRGFKVSVPEERGWKVIATFKDGATAKNAEFTLPATVHTKKLRLSEIVATTANPAQPKKMLEMADIQILDTNGRNWATHEPRYIGLADVDASASGLLKSGDCIPPIVAQARPTSAEVLARLNTPDRPPVLFRNRFGQGQAILLATTDGACRTQPALWSALIGLSGKNGPTYSVPADHERFAVLMNRLDKGISLHVVDRFGGHPAVTSKEIPIRVDVSRFGNVTDIYTVGCTDAKDIKRDGNEVTFTLKPSPSSTVLFEIPGGKPEAAQRRRSAPSNEFAAALADPMKVLNRDRKVLSAQEKQAVRLEAQKEAEDVKLELHGK